MRLTYTPFPIDSVPYLQGRRTADLTEQLAVAGSGDFQRLRSQLARSQQANADLQKVAHEKVDGMRAERDALAAEVAAMRGQLAARQDDSEQVWRLPRWAARVEARQQSHQEALNPCSVLLCMLVTLCGYTHAACNSPEPVDMLV